MYKLVLDGIQRTTNSVERWKLLGQHVGVRHPFTKIIHAKCMTYQTNVKKLQCLQEMGEID